MKNVGLEATYFNIHKKDVVGAQEALKAALGPEIVSVSISNDGNVCCMGKRVILQDEVREKLAACGLEFLGSYENTACVA